MVKLFARKFGSILGSILPMLLVDKLLGLCRNVYSGYLSTRFAVFGDNTVVKYPSVFVGEEFISIGKNVSLGRRSCITAWDKGSITKPRISIGDNTDIGDDCHITSTNNISIGDNVLFGKKITVTDNSHGRCDNYDELCMHPSSREVFSKGEVIIKNNVWVGDKVTVLSGVTLGEGCIIGANSVVTCDIPSYSIAVGIPAKVIKKFNN